MTLPKPGLFNQNIVNPYSGQHFPTSGPRGRLPQKNKLLKYSDYSAWKILVLEWDATRTDLRELDKRFMLRSIHYRMKQTWKRKPSCVLRFYSWFLIFLRFFRKLFFYISRRVANYLFIYFFLKPVETGSV